MSNELALTNSNLIFQQAEVTLKSLGATQEAFAALYRLRRRLANTKGNPQLQFKVIDAVTSGADGSDTALPLVNGAATLYFVYLKKLATATESFFKLSNHATAVQASSEVILSLKAASQEVVAEYEDGRPFATGIAGGPFTAYNGSVTTTHSNKADAPNGFILVGA